MVVFVLYIQLIIFVENRQTHNFFKNKKALVFSGCNSIHKGNKSSNIFQTFATKAVFVSFAFFFVSSIHNFSSLYSQSIFALGYKKISTDFLLNYDELKHTYLENKNFPVFITEKIVKPQVNTKNCFSTHTV